MPEERTPAQVAEAFKQAALDEARAALDAAIVHHKNASTHPSSRGPARPVTVTATAAEFLDFIRRAARSAGVDAEDVDPAPPADTEP